jgi:hypothetical protein
MQSHYPWRLLWDAVSALRLLTIGVDEIGEKRVWSVELRMKMTVGRREDA